MDVYYVNNVHTGIKVQFLVLCHFRNHKQAKSAKVEATHDLKMASECRSRHIPLLRDNDPVCASSEVCIQRNPGYAYGMAK